MPLILSGSAGLSGNVGTTTKEMLPAGSVLQVVQGVLADPLVYASNAWGDIGLQASITPLNATSKILVRVTVQVGANGTSYDGGLALVRNNTHIALPNNYGSRNACFMPLNQRAMSVYETATVSGEFLDSPNSLSAQTYKLQAYSNSNTQQFINRSGADDNTFADSRHISVITLMEIKA